MVNKLKKYWRSLIRANKYKKWKRNTVLRDNQIKNVASDFERDFELLLNEHYIPLSDYNKEAIWNKVTKQMLKRSYVEGYIFGLRRAESRTNNIFYRWIWKY